MYFPRRRAREKQRQGDKDEMCARRRRHNPCPSSMRQGSVPKYIFVLEQPCSRRRKSCSNSCCWWQQMCARRRRHHLCPSDVRPGSLPKCIGLVADGNQQSHMPNCSNSCSDQKKATSSVQFSSVQLSSVQFSAFKPKKCKECDANIRFYVAT